MSLVNESGMAYRLNLADNRYIWPKPITDNQYFIGSEFYLYR